MSEYNDEAEMPNVDEIEEDGSMNQPPDSCEVCYANPCCCDSIDEEQDW